MQLQLKLCLMNGFTSCLTSWKETSFILACSWVPWLRAPANSWTNLVISKFLSILWKRAILCHSAWNRSCVSLFVKQIILRRRFFSLMAKAHAMCWFWAQRASYGEGATELSQSAVQWYDSCSGPVEAWIFLCLFFTTTLTAMIFRWGNCIFFLLFFFFSAGPAVICVTGLKLLRSSFSDSSRQHLVLLWTVLFFHFDYRHSSETFVVDYFFMSIFMSKVWTIHKGSPIQSDCLIRYGRSPLSSSDREKRELLPARQHKYGGWGGAGTDFFARVYSFLFIRKVVPSHIIILTVEKREASVFFTYCAIF